MTDSGNRDIEQRHLQKNSSKIGSVRRMASSYLTGGKGEELLASLEVMELAEAVLPEDQLEHAEETARMLAMSRRNKIAAIERLTTLVSPPPKRPLYYAQAQMEYLPRWTRDGIRYLGDYIDVLVKHLAFHLTGDKGAATRSLGPCIEMIIRGENRTTYAELIGLLKRYNSFLYRPGKHDFRLPRDRKGHRFTSREVVLTAYITMNLAARIKAITNCNPNFVCHFDSDIQDEIERNTNW